MPTSGLVLTLRPGPSTGFDVPVAPLLAALGGQAEVTVGPLVAGRLAIVTETRDRTRDKALWDWLAARPEVLHIGLAFAHFEDPSTGGSPAAP